MDKKNYYKENKNIILNKIKEQYENDILNILKKLVQELLKDKYLIEDKKQKMKEYQKQYRENRTDEQKQKMKKYQKQYQREYRKNINNKQKMKEYQKQYRESKTDEQKQKMKEYQKKYRENKKILKQQNKDNFITS